MRLGIFGGSFDPVHNAHLALARACQAQAALDEIWFTPAAVQPLKQFGPHATSEQRLAMLRLAIEGEQGWRICTIEIDRGGMSYTVDTLRAIHDERPADALFFLLGGDTIQDVPHWREPAEIFRLATPLVVQRGERAPDLAALAKLCPSDKRPLAIDMPPLEISSREIRCRVAAGDTIEELVPRSVAEYVATHHLYR